MTNVKRMEVMSEKFLGYGVWVYSYLCAVLILENKEWVAQQTWGEDISVAHQKIIARYKYNHVHDAESIREILRIITTADAAQDQRKSKPPG